MNRYIVAVGSIGVIYTLVQIPFAIHNVAKEKRLIRNGFLQEFDFYGDKVNNSSTSLVFAINKNLDVYIIFHQYYSYNGID